MREGTELGDETSDEETEAQGRQEPEDTQTVSSERELSGSRDPAALLWGGSVFRIFSTTYYLWERTGGPFMGTFLQNPHTHCSSPSPWPSAPMLSKSWVYLLCFIPFCPRSPWGWRF